MLPSADRLRSGMRKARYQLPITQALLLLCISVRSSRSLHLFGWLEFSCTLDVLQHLKCVVQSSLGGAIYCFEMHDLLRKTSCPKDETWPWGQEPALRVAPGL